MPFEVPGSGPMNPTGRGTQGNTFEEQPFEGMPIKVTIMADGDKRWSC